MGSVWVSRESVVLLRPISSCEPIRTTEVEIPAWLLHFLNVFLNPRPGTRTSPNPYSNLTSIWLKGSWVDYRFDCLVFDSLVSRLSIFFPDSETPHSCTAQIQELPDEFDSAVPSTPEPSVAKSSQRDSHFPLTLSFSPSRVENSGSPSSISPMITSWVESELPSPSCVPDSQAREWNMDVFPFDATTLEGTCISLGRMFNLEQVEGQAKVEEVLSSKAKEMHKRKLRPVRTKLEMEQFLLGPSPAVATRSRRHKSRDAGGNLISGIDG
ncbi:unnamed protein product [Linum trigynum]|uniref:Uncharacterized protein n=1 Tax=Linum trigynum TaxID=586398 RepID=A0AAV2GA87_9ROSI